MSQWILCDRLIKVRCKFNQIKEQVDLRVWSNNGDYVEEFDFVMGSFDLGAADSM